jgi:hypothetical protein
METLGWESESGLGFPIPAPDTGVFGIGYAETRYPIEQSQI